MNPEALFGMTAGDLWVLQTPGAVVSDGEIAAMELARHTHGTPLVVVLTHTPCPVLERCGAIGGASCGAASHEARASERVAWTNRRTSQHDVARTQAVRMAARAQHELPKQPDIVTVAAHLDEASGRVEWLVANDAIAPASSTGTPSG